jgi:hypothetical protein
MEYQPLVVRSIDHDQFTDLLGAVPPIKYGITNGIEHFFMGEPLAEWLLDNGSSVTLYLLILRSGDRYCEVATPLNTAISQYSDFISQVQ